MVTRCCAFQEALSCLHLVQREGIVSDFSPAYLIVQSPWPPGSRVGVLACCSQWLWLYSDVGLDIHRSTFFLEDGAAAAVSSCTIEPVAGRGVSLLVHSVVHGWRPFVSFWLQHVFQNVQNINSSKSNSWPNSFYDL